MGYLPRRESELLTWAQHFDATLATSAGTYNLSAGQAAAFNALFTAFQNAYMTATNPPTRTTPAIAAKKTAKQAMVNGPGGIRELARLIQAAPSVTDQEKLDIGLPIHDTEPSPVPPPTIAPEIDFMMTGTRTIRIRLHNEKALNRKKPVGVKGALVFSYTGETPPADINLWKFETNTTKVIIEIQPPVTVTSGTTVWFTAFWYNPRAQSGPATTPVSTVVQYGGMAKAA